MAQDTYPNLANPGKKDLHQAHDSAHEVIEAPFARSGPTGGHFARSGGTFELVFDQTKTFCRNLLLLLPEGIGTAALDKHSEHRQHFEAQVAEMFQGLLAAGRDPGAVLVAAGAAIEEKGLYQITLETFRDTGEPIDKFKKELFSKNATSLTLATLALGVVMSGPFFGGGRLGRLPHGFPSRIDALAAKSQPFTGDPGAKLGLGVIKANRVEVDKELLHTAGETHVLSSELNYIKTSDLREKDLGYSGGLRPKQDVDLTNIPIAPVTKILNITPVSEWHSGSKGLVRIGELADGRPVALKAYYSHEGSAGIAEEIRSAKLYSDLGIGPRFHGTFVDNAGKPNIVTDVVRGDFVNAVPQNINRQTFVDLETMLQRLQQAKINELDDGFQCMIDEKGRMLAIDSDGITAKIGKEPKFPPNGPSGQFTQERFELAFHADQEVAGQYLADLRRSNPNAYSGLAQAYQDRRVPMPRH